ncbi:unnamed protein product [Thlaspi arvense]|uniref:Bacterial surface antigen (D15) domain-containing protein n=1 Tax=Thlaspi arvense TaxID=13288 RepID=A0AAU9T278_THLAR|nr:unnamed protein product [Thlaspi arvense]
MCLKLISHAGARDDKGNPIIKDSYNSPLTASGNTHDDTLLAKFECVYTGSGDPGSSMFIWWSCDWKFLPYEAFAIGGTNSVRGYEEGAVGSGRSYAVGSGEMAFPLLESCIAEIMSLGVRG